MSGSPRGSIETSYQVVVAYAETSGALATTYVAVETLSGDERTIVRKTSRLRVLSDHKMLTGPGLPSIVLDECSSVAVQAWTETGWHEVMRFTEQEPDHRRGSHAAAGGKDTVPDVEGAARAAHAFLHLFGEPLASPSLDEPDQPAVAAAPADVAPADVYQSAFD